MVTENLKKVLCFILYTCGAVTTFMGLITLYATGFYVENFEMIVVGCAVSVIGVLSICCGTLVEDRIYEGDI
jgi:MFS-type transporter involved in bile tolerance (Atg22 family)